MKNLNPTKAKAIATQLINIADYFVQQFKKSIDFLTLYSLEGKCIMADPQDIKEIYPILEAQMTK